MEAKLLIGDWVLNLTSGQVVNITDTSRTKNLTSKPLLLVTILVEGNGEVVSKSELVDKVWGGYTSPENISQVVNKLRVIFEDKEKNIFVNHPGIGYSLVFSLNKDEKLASPNDSKFEKASPQKSLHSSKVAEQQTVRILYSKAETKTKTNALVSLLKHCGIVLLLITFAFIFHKEYYGFVVNQTVDRLPIRETVTIWGYTCIQETHNEKLFCQK